MSFGSRLKERREAAGLTQRDLGKLLGVSGNAVGNYEKGISSPNANILYKVFDVLQCDANYLFQDEMEELKAITFSVHEQEHIKKYRALDGHGKKIVDMILEEETARISAEQADTLQPSNIIPLRCSLQPASAGTGMYLGPEEFDIIQVVENDLTSRASFAVPVSGNSMEPRFHDGDVLLVEGAEDVQIGEIGVFTIGGEGYVKQRGYGILHSINPDYNDVPLTEDSRCNGHVIGKLDPEWVV